MTTTAGNSTQLIGYIPGAVAFTFFPLLTKNIRQTVNQMRIWKYIRSIDTMHSPALDSTATTFTEII